MEEKVIVRSRGIFGRVQVTLPLPAKLSILEWQKKSGMGKAAFLRVALMIGAAKLADDLKAKKPDEGYQLGSGAINSQAAART